MSEEVGRAAILVISQVEEHRVQVTLTLTSTEMRDTPSPEQTSGMCLHCIPPFPHTHCSHKPHYKFTIYTPLLVRGVVRVAQ